MLVVDASGLIDRDCSAENLEMMSLPKVRYSAISLLAVWGLVVGSGILFLESYASRPGDAGSPPVCCPADSRVHSDVGKSNLFIFLHPKCPCSRASVDELRSILSECGKQVSAHAFLFSPAHGAGTWGDSDIERALAATPGIQIHDDKGGLKARRFGVETSGHVVLYDQGGHLTYSGGITAARGHSGENFGRSAVIDQIKGMKGQNPANPVFGCALAAFDSSVGEEAPR